MLLFVYGPKCSPETSECSPNLDGPEAGRTTRSGRVAWVYFGF